MQNTSQTWKDLWASNNAVLEARAVINGTVYTDLPTAPVVNRALMQTGPSIGNAVSATCQLSLRTNEEIPKSAEVVIQYRLTDGTTTSEWLNAGTFYISRRQKNPVTNVLSLICYDALLKANMPMPSTMPWTNEDGEVITTETDEWIYLNANYPRSMASVLNDLLLVLDLELDPATQIETDSIYVIDDVNVSTTINEVLCRIAAANCGNWIITPAGKLRLVPLVSASGAESAVTNVIDVDGIVGSIGTNNTGTITGIRYETKDGSAIAGSDNGIVIDVSLPVEIVEDILVELSGVDYQAFEINGAVYDPAAELGDYVRAGANGEIRAVLCSEVSTYGAMYTGNISAPEIGEMADEYPYIGKNATAITQLNYRLEALSDTFEEEIEGAETRANAVTAALNRSLDQQGIFNRLTNNGQTQGIYLQDGKLYINGTYISAGTLNADLLRAGIIADASGKNYWILDGNNSEFVTKKGIIGRFLIDNEGLQSSSGGGTGASITNDGIKYKISTTSQGVTKTLSSLLNWNGLGFYIDDVLKTLVYMGNTNNGLGIRCLDKNGESYWPFQIDLDTTIYSFASNIVTVRFFFRCTDSVMIDKNLTVTGTKSRVVSTDQYSDRLLYCYETPSPMFGDVGEGKIGDDGKCYIWLDPVFAQTITTTQYQVFLQRYGSGECWVSERNGNYFVVEGTPGMAFGWELKAKQRDYDQRRLERNDTPFTVPAQSYGIDAAKHIEDLRKERIPE